MARRKLETFPNLTLRPAKPASQHANVSTKIRNAS